MLSTSMFLYKLISLKTNSNDRHGCIMVVGFTTTCVISAYHH